MKLRIVHLACAALFVLGPAALALAQRPDPAPQQPTPQQQREQAEREKNEREQAEKRKKAAREQAENQDREEARRREARAREAEQANPNNPRRGAGNQGVRQDLFELERKNRQITARLDRIAEIYRQTGQERKLAQVEALRAKQQQRYQRFISIYREKLGPKEYAAIDANLRAGRERRTANARSRAEANNAGSDTPRKP
jgi:hypothetical protein